MNVLITGANGFLGKNLIEKLVDLEDCNIFHYDVGTSELLLENNLKNCDFVFHFAAVHRPIDKSEFYKVNDDFFGYILNTLEKFGNTCPVLLTSSIQAGDQNDYGRSKVIAENMLKEHGKKMNSKTIIYRLNNVFGKWATPNHHSVVATFCYNINRDIPIEISNRDILMHFYYVDDVINSFISQFEGKVKPSEDGIFRLPENQVYDITLGELADTLIYFRDCQKNGVEPTVDSIIKKYLLVTYKSYEKS